MTIRGFQQEIKLTLAPSTPPWSCLGCPNLKTKELGALGVDVSMCQLEQAANEKKGPYNQMSGQYEPSRRRAPKTIWVMEAVFNPDSVNRGLIPASQLDFRGRVHRANDECPINESLVAAIGQTFPGQPYAEVEVIPPAPLVTYDAYEALSALEG